MRRTATTLALAAGLLAGCSDGGPVELAVTTPPASATAGAPTTQGPTTQGPPTQAPPATGAPVTPVPPAGTAAGPRAAYQVLAGQWQQARAEFFGAVSDGTPRAPAAQRALAGRFLSAQRRFAAAVRATRWPAGARAAVTALLARNAQQQATLAAMAGARTAAEFTGRLADYGVATAAENRAVAAVAAALN